MDSPFRTHRPMETSTATMSNTQGSDRSPLSHQVSRRKFLIQSGLASVGVVGLYTTPVLRTVLVGPAHAATGTPTPTPPPILECDLTADPAYLDHHKLKIEITNPTGVDAVLVAFHLVWSEGASNCFVKVKLNTRGAFYDPAADECSGNITINSGFHSDPWKRTIAAGATKKLQFDFVNDLSSSESYSGYAEFDTTAV